MSRSAPSHASTQAAAFDFDVVTDAPKRLAPEVATVTPAAASGAPEKSKAEAAESR